MSSVEQAQTEEGKVKSSLDQFIEIVAGDDKNSVGVVEGAVFKIMANNQGLGPSENFPLFSNKVGEFLSEHDLFLAGTCFALAFVNQRANAPFNESIKTYAQNFLNCALKQQSSAYLAPKQHILAEIYQMALFSQDEKLQKDAELLAQAINKLSQEPTT